jgi:hypothetical protein
MTFTSAIHTHFFDSLGCIFIPLYIRHWWWWPYTGWNKYEKRKWQMTIYCWLCRLWNQILCINPAAVLQHCTPAQSHKQNGKHSLFILQQRKINNPQNVTAGGTHSSHDPLKCNMSTDRPPKHNFIKTTIHPNTYFHRLGVIIRRIYKTHHDRSTHLIQIYIWNTDITLQSRFCTFSSGLNFCGKHRGKAVPLQA